MAGPFGQVLDRLGISPPWEVEVFQICRLPSGLHFYGGWFHFVGSIESGQPAWKVVESAASFKSADFEPLFPGLAIGFHADVALVRPVFEGLPLVQLEWSAELPWVIEAPEPD